MIKKHVPTVSFRNKLIIIFSTVVLLSILSIGIFSYYETSRTIVEEIEKFSNKNLKEVNLNLERFFKEYEEIFFNIAANKEFERWLMAGKEDRLNLSLSYANLFDYCIKPVAAIRQEIIAINLLNENGNENAFFLNSNLFFKEGYSLKDEPWVKNTSIENRTMIISGKNNNYRNSKGAVNDLLTIRLLKKFKFSDAAAGYIQVDVSMNPVIEILNEMRYSDNGEGMLLDETGLIMAHTDSSRISSSYDREFFNESLKGRDSGCLFDKSKNRIVVFRTMQNIGWKSVAVIPFNEATKGLYRIRNVTLLIAALSLMLFVLMIILISSSLTKRIKKMMKIIKQTQMGNIHLRVAIPGKDEISELANAYNAMLDHLEGYINELAEAKFLQQEAVLSALQAQINSHFLYNTLELVNSMAYMAGHSDIRKAVVSLSKMLRYTSNYREYIVTFKEEVGHLKDYMNIMELQMGENLTYDIAVEENFEEVLCLKAIFQPIVENSLRHGFELTGKPITIKIKAGYLDSKYGFVTIRDNGTGFKEEKLQEIRNQLQCMEGIAKLKEISKVGLVNVNYRLKVFYRDEETGVFVRNLREHGGAEVKIVFPLQREDVI